jgi:hypothetical protein
MNQPLDNSMTNQHSQGGFNFSTEEKPPKQPILVPTSWKKPNNPATCAKIQKIIQPTMAEAPKPPYATAKRRFFFLHEDYQL